MQRIVKSPGGGNKLGLNPIPPSGALGVSLSLACRLGHVNKNCDVTFLREAAPEASPGRGLRSAGAGDQRRNPRLQSGDVLAVARHERHILVHLEVQDRLDERGILAVANLTMEDEILDGTSLADRGDIVTDVLPLGLLRFGCHKT